MSAIGLQSLFGPLTASSDVERAITDTLTAWHPDYLSEVERQHRITVGTLQRLRSAQTSYDFENWPEGQLPALVVVCPGTVGPLEREGPGSYNGWFEVMVGVLVEDATEADARRVTQLHQAAIDGALVQHGSLRGFASDLILTGRQSRLPDVDNRTLAYAESVFHVLVDGIVNREGGPTGEPSTDGESPWPPLPEIQQTELDLRAEPPILP